MATGRLPEGSLGLLVTNAVLKITVITPQQSPPLPLPLTFLSPRTPGRLTPTLAVGMVF